MVFLKQQTETQKFCLFDFEIQFKKDSMLDIIYGEYEMLREASSFRQPSG